MKALFELVKINSYDVITESVEQPCGQYEPEVVPDCPDNEF